MSTINTKLIVPEVYSALVREKITGKCKVAQFATTKGILMGQAGETVKFPAYKYIGDAADWQVGTAMTAGELEQTTTSAIIKAIAAPGVNVYDYDDDVAMGQQINEAASQQAVSIARKMDTDAIDACLTSIPDPDEDYSCFSLMFTREPQYTPSRYGAKTITPKEIDDMF